MTNTAYSAPAERWILPVILAALTLVAVAAPRLTIAESLGISVDAGNFLLLGLEIAAFYPLIAALERILPERAEWNRSHEDVRTDLAHLLFSGSLAQLLFQATLGAATVKAGVWLGTRIGARPWPSHAPIIVQMFLAIWIAEFGHYWFHRLSHENALVWRVHAVHHSARRLYWLNATRFQWFDIFSLISLQSIPLLLLGAGREALLPYTMFAAVYGQLQHMNVRVRSPWVDWIFSTPALHRWHHSTDPREGNQNYGAILIFWDQLFGTFFRPRRRAFDAEVGIADLPRFPTSYLAQQLSPLRWR